MSFLRPTVFFRSALFHAGEKDRPVRMALLDC